MMVGGIGNNSVSWAQFVTATQAARQRNSGLTAGNAANAVKAAAQPPSATPSPIVSQKFVNNVYSGYGSIQKAQSISTETRRTLGGMFDSYA